MTSRTQHISETAAELLRVDEMARADALAVAGGTAGVVLMEAAGRGIADQILERWEQCPTVVLCGPGNNGGDGFVVARLLADAGWDVALSLLGGRDRLRGDAAIMADRWSGAVDPLGPDALDGRELVVDAIFGAGLSRPVEGTVAALVDDLNDRQLPCVAVDVPSGIHGDTGAVLGTAVRATLTVTFFRRKPGHLLMPGRLHCGDTVTVDIGIAETVIDDIAPQTRENTPGLWLDQFPRPRPAGHKYDRGHAVVVSGGAAKTGAARLAARGALRAGAGLVTVASPPDAVLENASQLTAVMTLKFDGAGGLRTVLGDRRKNAVLLGPGNGVTAATRQNVLAALEIGTACVLDADALSVFADRPRDLFDAVPPRCLMTPHWGEFGRIFADAVAAADDNPLGLDKVEVVREAARVSGAAVLLKGADTVIAAPDGRAAINTNAPPELATAGSGDVLAGIGLGLLAQGMDPFEAGCAAAWLHGAAATAFGPGLIAEDIVAELPGILRRLREPITS